MVIQYPYPYMQKTESRGNILFNIIKPYLCEGDNILDVCCGYSPMARHLLKAGHRVSGFDIMPEPIAYLKNLLPQGNWFQTSYENLSIQDSFQVMLVIGVGSPSPFEDYSAQGFKDFLCRLSPHIILMEAPLEQKDSSYSELVSLVKRRYQLVASGEYDSMMPFPPVERRVFSLWSNITSDMRREMENDGFLKNPGHCREEWFLVRDSVLIEMVKDISLKAVFEFAGGSGFLAELFLKKYPGTIYLLSDYSAEACRLARQNLARFPEASVEEFDIVNDLDKVSWDGFDLVVSTSMEHLPKGVDLQILERVRSGAQVLFCLAAFGGMTHPHHYPSKEYVVERFSPLIKIKQLLVMLFPRATTYHADNQLVATENFVFLLYGERL